jgi:hypothetical protein
LIFGFLVGFCRRPGGFDLGLISHQFDKSSTINFKKMKVFSRAVELVFMRIGKVFCFCFFLFCVNNYFQENKKQTDRRASVYAARQGA